MPISLRLDAPAVRALIKDDETFALDLSTAVVAEIVKKLPAAFNTRVERQITTEIDQMVTELASRRYDSTGRNRPPTLSQALSSEIKRVADNHVRLAIDQAIQKADAIADERIARIEKDIEGRIAFRISSAVADAINKGVVARLNEVVSGVTAKATA